MQTIDATILWEPPKGAERGQVAVFRYDDQLARRRFAHLSREDGARLVIWCVNGALDELFRTFLRVAGDGLAPADIHREFLKMDEYAGMVNGTAYFGVEQPLHQVEAFEESLEQIHDR